MANKRFLIIFLSIFSSILLAGLIFLILYRTLIFDKYSSIIKYDYDSSIKYEIKENEAKIDNLIATNTNYDEIINTYNLLNDYCNKLNSYKKIEYLNICKEEKQENIKRYNEIYDILNDYTDWLNEFYNNIYYSSFKDLFYEGKSESDIYYLLNIYSEEAKNAKKEIEDLENDASYNDFYEFYAEFVNAKNKFAKILGYDNYFDYSNERVYFRDYDENDILVFANYINSYILSSNGIYSSVRNKWIMSRSTNPYVLGYSSLDYSDYNSVLNDYYSDLSSEIYDFYNNYSDYIVQYKNNNSYQGAFTVYLYALDTPSMFLGPNSYSSVSTFVHEFGHSYSYTKAKLNDVSYDLCEFQSQGDELLFLAYICKNYDLSTNDIRYLANEKLLSFLGNLVNCTYTGLIESKAYNLSIVNTETIKKAINDSNSVLSNIVRFDTNSIFNYFTKVAISDSMYYISYATSIINSLELYLNAYYYSFDNAKNIWLNICDYNNYSTYLNTISEAGLSSPFEENIYKKLSLVL